MFENPLRHVSAGVFFFRGILGNSSTFDDYNPNIKYVTVDGCLNGTGIRDKYNGRYLYPSELGLSTVITSQIEAWVSKYENEHFEGFTNKNVITELDAEGRIIARKIKEELADVKMEYFSAATMAWEIIN